MSAGHTHRFFVHADTGVHRLAPECKLAATVLFVFAVVATPREAVWAFGPHGSILLAVAVAARVPIRRLARRLVLELPFIAFAFLLPFVGRGERVDVWFLSLSVPGLWGAWNIVVKGTLGVAATSLLSATTTVPELLQALERLRVPRVIVSITAFMVRYADLLVGDLRRMRIARLSRAHDARWLWQAGAVARSAGTLFIRSYERGERVYVAMLARGYGGSVPSLGAGRRARAGGWLKALSAPLGAAAICLTAVVAT
jgi:cobalt/nickel transport system permease protein